MKRSIPALLALACASLAHAQSWPSKPIRYIVIFAAGGTFSSHAINATLYPKLPYDPDKEFAPITMLATLPNMLVAHPGLSVNRVQELIALRNTDPNKHSFGSAGNDTSQHMDDARGARRADPPGHPATGQGSARLGREGGLAVSPRFHARFRDSDA